MKRLFLIISTILTLTACSNEGAYYSATNDGSIKFGNIATRVPITNASEIDQFTVYAEQNLGADRTTEAHQWVSLLENERVYKDGSDFTYDNTRYWIENRTFFFFAVYPYGTSVTRTEDTIVHDGENATEFAYSVDVSVPYAANTDYLVAQRTVCTNDVESEADYPTVGLSFEHLLSQINVKVKKADDNAKDTFIVTQIGLSNISRTASFKAVHAPNSYTETFIVATESRRVRRQGLSVELTTNGVDVLGDDGLLVIPQELGSVKLTLEYSYKGESEKEVTYSTVEVDIPTDAVSKWEKGKKYTYTLTLEFDHNIYIGTPTVSDWSTPQAGGTIIIQ